MLNFHHVASFPRLHHKCCVVLTKEANQVQQVSFLSLCNAVTAASIMTVMYGG